VRTTGAFAAVIDGLTPAGVRFVTALQDEVRPWLDEPVGADVARLASAANTDHHLRWRVRNLAVDPGTVAAIAAAWRHGLRPPAPEANLVRLLPTPRRALESSDRLALTHRHLRDNGTPDLGDSGSGADHSSPKAGGDGRVSGEAAGGRATAGDAAYLRGDYGAALRAYQKRVVEEPADNAAWAGLALVSGEKTLMESVEVVAAVYRAGGGGEDPLALAKWLSLG
jgi:hypothetical protein